MSLGTLVVAMDDCNADFVSEHKSKFELRMQNSSEYAALTRAFARYYGLANYGIQIPN